MSDGFADILRHSRRRLPRRRDCHVASLLAMTWLLAMTALGWMDCFASRNDVAPRNDGVGRDRLLRSARNDEAPRS